MEWHDLVRDTWQTTLVFAALFGFTRILGKTQVGQLTFYEYISGITIGSIAGNIVAGEPEKYLSNFYDLVIFVLLTYLLSFITLKNRPIRNFIEGQSTILIENGVILKDNMRQVRLDIEELTAQLRQQGVLDVADIQFAVLETSGNLSLIKKNELQESTKADLGLAPAASSYPLEVIMDGILLEENLKKHRLSREWLSEELALQNIKKVEDVFYGVLDSNGKLFISRQNEKKA